MPEYGRNIQRMIAHCRSIEDREERNRCARTIIRAMEAIVPEKGAGLDKETIYWDHLAIMADFELDVDYPDDYPRGDHTQDREARLPRTPHPVPLLRTLHRRYDTQGL